jgi:hypothetical protein
MKAAMYSLRATDWDAIGGAIGLTALAGIALDGFQEQQACTDRARLEEAEQPKPERKKNESGQHVRRAR